MFSNVQLHTVGMMVLLCSLLLPRAIAAQSQLGEGVLALPYHTTRHLLSAEERAALERLELCTDPELASLLASEDPRELGMGIYVASHRRDLDLLLSLSHLLDDKRPTIPVTDIFARRARWVAEGEANYFPRDISVSQLLSEKYGSWFNVRIASRQDFDEKLGHIEDPDLLAAPWRSRLPAALFSKLRLYDPGPLEEVKAEIRQLPPDLRWVVLARTPGGSFTEHEMLEEIRRLPASIREAPPEQLTVPGDPLISDKTLQQARARFVKLRDLAALGESAPQEP